MSKKVKNSWVAVFTYCDAEPAAYLHDCEEDAIKDVKDNYECYMRTIQEDEGVELYSLCNADYSECRIYQEVDEEPIAVMYAVPVYS